MSTPKFIILMIVLLNVCGGLLLHKYLKEREDVDASQERRIDHIYDLLGIE